MSENTTTGQDADGGGMFANGIVNILRSDVSGNLAEGRFAGGGAIATDMADVMIEGSSITNNRTTGEFGYGGGLFSVRGNVTISQSTISGNTTAGADADGGGVNVFFSSFVRNGEHDHVEFSRCNWRWICVHGQPKQNICDSEFHRCGQQRFRNCT